MTTCAAVVPWTGDPGPRRTLESLQAGGPVSRAAVVTAPRVAASTAPYETIRVSSPRSTAGVCAVLRWFEHTGADLLLWVIADAPVFISGGPARLAGHAAARGAALAYADHHDLDADGTGRPHPLIDYQPGSIRDNFDFGPVVALSRAGIEGLAHEMERDAADLEHAGWYALRLRLAERGPVVRLAESVCTSPRQDTRSSGQRVFDYVDPHNQAVQREMERAATAHLKRIGAWLPPPAGTPVEDDRRFAVEASVVIPVKDRARTIADAVDSALSQKTSFEFNVVVVDNHSSDGTTAILEERAGRDRRLVHLVPSRRDLGIGGCWNQAIGSEACGRWTVQLDSDDLYDGDRVLERIVDTLRHSDSPFLIGAYTTVDFELNPLPPGLVAHHEWTEENGHNNALRVNGLGAPRAFHTPTLRTIGFPNVSYGEDYAVALRLCRSYRVARIYDSLYWCRRWEDNTDSALPLETKNRYDRYKDGLRTAEIAARQQERATRP